MLINTARTRKYLQAGDLKTLFVEVLGWDRLKTTLQVTVGAETFTLAPVAEKRGVQIFQCSPNAGGKIPEYAVRRRIEAEVTKSAFQHVIVFTDREVATQVWQWVSREVGKPLAYREQTYHVEQSGDALLQKLERISFALTEEDGLTLSGVEFKIKDAFNKERVTKKFYDRFQKEHTAFLDFIKNIPDGDLQRWYASVMINRLMFLYFIQAKGFLDSDLAYLKNRLKQSRGHFYRDFLCPLFFEGFATRTHSPEITKKLGRVPYLNGGLFAKHQIEERYGEAIAIPDSAFEKLFAFFDGYNWHLDDRPLKNDNEINPDVLGYIFEKYINQKQMGAYYTKEDITEYIGKNTILPFLLDRAREDCQVAFQDEGGLWRLLREDPDRYIYPAVKHRLHKADGTERHLPEAIAQGITDVAARGGWNNPAPSDYALPTEIWREVVARRQRYAEVRAKLSAGEVRDTGELITYNLNIRQYAQDCIEQGGPEFLLAVWNVLNGTKEGRLPLSILDPTCGSGAFLFAALEILDPLYEACLERMASFVADANLLGHNNDHTRFRDILKGAALHTDRRYFVLKSIIVNNLFGVDIMEEATEICKLRLFLTLAAQVEADPKRSNFGIEPLPDIDFNIRAGNTLVGFATAAQTEKAVRGRLDFDDDWLRIQSRAAAVAKLFEDFQQSQNDPKAEPGHVAGMKKNLRDGLKPLRDELDKYLEPPREKAGKESLAAWKKSTQPFHWYIEFYRVMNSGGFDVAIGNPPYVIYNASKTSYPLRSFATLSCSNLFAFATERALDLLKIDGHLGFIVPVSSISTEGYKSLQDVVFKFSGHFSSFDDRPARLFDGLEHIQLTIHLVKKSRINVRHFSTECLRWSASEREYVFASIEYQPVNINYLPSCLPKISSSYERFILQKIWRDTQAIGIQTVKNSPNRVYYSRKVHNFLQALDFVPEVYNGNGNLRAPSELKDINFTSSGEASLVFCLLNSTLFRWFINVFSDCRHVNKREVSSFKLDLRRELKDNEQQWQKLAAKLSQSLKETAEFRNMRFKHDELRVQCIIPKKSKSIIDQIDRVLAEHYGFTEEETDFIINYDIKYRMGRGGNDTDDE